MENKEIPIAKIIGFSKHQVKIFCPYCSQAHYHGITGGPGHVSSHCLDRPPQDVGYIIPDFNTYNPDEAAELEKLAKGNKRRVRRYHARH